MVSIVIPYYNRPIKLKRALDSINNQSYKDFEIIIIDDASDKPFEAYDNKLFEKINYIRCNNNKGPGVARNVGLEVAKGDYVIFLDSDDYLHRDFLKKCVNVLKNNIHSIMAYSNGYCVDENENIIEEMRKDSIKPNSILPHILQYGRPWGTGACLWSKEKISQIEWIETRGWEDYAFDVSAAIICNDIIFVDEYLVFYDNSGSDKLSFQNPINSVVEKNKSIRYISECLKESSFFYNKIIKKQLVKLLLNNTIALMVNRIKDYKLYSHNIQMLKVYKGVHISFIVFILIHINNKLGLSLLRRLRRRILN